MLLWKFHCSTNSEVLQIYFMFKFCGAGESVTIIVKILIWVKVICVCCGEIPTPEGVKSVHEDEV